MSDMQEREIPSPSAGGKVATAFNAVGGFLGHTGRVIDNTDKGFEELNAGRPGLGLLKATAATGVWATRKAVMAPLKSVPGLDVVGGEIGKIPFTVAGLSVEAMGKGLQSAAGSATSKERIAQAARDYGGYRRRQQTGEEPSSDSVEPPIDERLSHPQPNQEAVEEESFDEEIKNDAGFIDPEGDA
jgi:hypothetical protein